MEPTVGHDSTTQPSSPRGLRSPGSMGTIKDRRVLLTFLIDTLDLPLLRSPSFLLFSLACTLHMFGEPITASANSGKIHYSLPKW